jgi:hypothetical protein
MCCLSPLQEEKKKTTQKTGEMKEAREKGMLLGFQTLTMTNPK